MNIPSSGGRVPHISVCICTYKRQDLLQRTLAAVAELETNNAFTYSLVVADNDKNQSARPAVERFKAKTPLEVIYCVEPEQNISLARNLAVKNARGDYIAFLDDDEFPKKDWLLRMIQACSGENIAGVVGRVTPHYPEIPPSWLLKGNFCQRPFYLTGTILHWVQTTTANAFFRSEIICGLDEPFNPHYTTGGEDTDFFKRMIEKGRVFIWCDEAVVFETIPRERWKRLYLLKRAWLRGQSQIQRKVYDWRSVTKSLLALPIYACLIPFTGLLGSHYFMNNSVRMCDHCGKIFALLGFKPLGNKYLSS